MVLRFCSYNNQAQIRTEIGKSENAETWKVDWLLLKFNNTFLDNQPETNCIYVTPKKANQRLVWLIE